MLSDNLRYSITRAKINYGIWKIHAKDKIQHLIPRHYHCEGCKTTFWIFDRAVIYPSCPSCNSREHINRGYNAQTNPRYMIGVYHKNTKQREFIKVRQTDLERIERRNDLIVYAKQKID